MKYYCDIKIGIVCNGMLDPLITLLSTWRGFHPLLAQPHPHKATAICTTILLLTAPHPVTTIEYPKSSLCQTFSCAANTLAS